MLPHPCTKIFFTPERNAKATFSKLKDTDDVLQYEQKRHTIRSDSHALFEGRWAYHKIRDLLMMNTLEPRERQPLVCFTKDGQIHYCYREQLSGRAEQLSILKLLLRVCKPLRYAF